MEGDQRLGTLFVKSDLKAAQQRFGLYGLITALVIALATLLAYLVSRWQQSQISQPILALAETASAVSDQHDYAVRAAAADTLEIDVLTDAFNHMLTQIQESRGAPACADGPPEPAAADHRSDRRTAGSAEHLPGRAAQRGGEPADRLRLRLPVRRRGGNADREHRRRGQPEPVSAPRPRRARRRAHRRERLVALHAGTPGLRA